MATLDLAQEKLLRKVRAARNKWVEMVKKSDSLEAYIQGVAAVSGLSPEEVRASLPTQNWRDFQSRAEEYVDVMISKVEAAIRSNKWKNHYIEAFRAK